MDIMGLSGMKEVKNEKKKVKWSKTYRQPQEMDRTIGGFHVTSN